MKSTLPILLAIAMILCLIIIPLCSGNLPPKVTAGICAVTCFICLYWSAFAAASDDSKIEKLEKRIEELEKEKENK